MFLNCESLCIRQFETLAWTGSGHWGEFNINNVLSSEYIIMRVKCFELYKYSIRHCFNKLERLMLLKLDHQINYCWRKCCNFFFFSEYLWNLNETSSTDQDKPVIPPNLT